MKRFIIYLVLFAFYFLSLSPAGVSLPQIIAYDDFQFDDLDDPGSTDDLDDLDDLDSMFDDPLPSESGSEDSSFGFDDFSSTSSTQTDISGKKIAAFYLFADSYSEEKAKDLVAETASYLSSIADYNYVQTEASLFVSEMSSVQRELDRGIEMFKEAKVLYEDLMIEDAISTFKQALSILEKHLDKLPELKMISDILLYLGASYRMLDEDERAAPYFNSYININPLAELDDIIFSPEIVSFFNRVKDDHLMLPTGSVFIDSYPKGSLVFIDGRIAGITPLRIEGLPQGSHYYRIHKTGYRSRAGTVEIRERRESKLSESLQGYSEASYIDEATEIMSADYGTLSMLRKAAEVAEKLNVEEVAVMMVVAQDEKIKYYGHIVNKEKRSFKKSETEFEMPFDNNFGKVYEVESFHNDLFKDSFGFRSISDVALDEAELLGLGESTEKDDGKKKGSGSKWWLWTILGVVVLGGAGVGTYFIITETRKDKSGAELEINF